MGGIDGYATTSAALCPSLPFSPTIPPMTLLTLLVLCLLFAVVYLIIVAQRIEKATASIAWTLDAPRRAIAELEHDREVVEEALEEGKAIKSNMEAASFIERRLARLRWRFPGLR
jgi:hypothetical protein